MFQADGWKDISKNHLVAFMITVDQKVCTCMNILGIYAQIHIFITI
jgi:hypothetical protein